MKIYQKKAKSCLSNFLYKSNFFYSTVSQKQNNLASLNQLQNDIEFQFNFFLKNRSNLYSPASKSSFQQKNRDKFDRIENKILAELNKEVHAETYTHISKYLNILSNNIELKQKFFALFLENMKKMNLGPVIETSWYFCLDSSIDNRKKMHHQLTHNYFNKKIESSFSLNYSTSYKMMLSQLRFDALQFKLDLISQASGGTENIELVSLEEMPVNLYQVISTALIEKGITVVSANKFFEMYNLGVELQNKIILDLWRTENKEINSIFKLIRLNHLLRSGYSPLSLTIQNVKNVDMNEICKSINEFQLNLNKSKI